MEQYRPSHNVSPGAWTPVVINSPNAGPEVVAMKWGLVPHFHRPTDKLDHYCMFNARCETVAEKPVFKQLLPSKRCVVLLNGFYEWKAEGSRKQPYYVNFGDKQPVMRMAGLYDVWHDPATGEDLPTYTIITTDSSEPLTWLHDRMPVLLPDDQAVSAWLGQQPLQQEEAGEEDRPLQRQQQYELEGPRPATSGGGSEHPQTGKGIPSGSESYREAIEASGGHGPGEASTPKPSGKQQQEAGKGRCGGHAHAGGGAAAAVGVVKLVEQVCKPYGGPLLHWHPVTPAMSKPGYDAPDCCVDVRTRKGSISSFFKPVKKEEQHTEQPGAAHTCAGASAQGEAGSAAAVAAAAAQARNSDECPGANGGAPAAAAAGAGPGPRPAGRSAGAQQKAAPSLAGSGKRKAAASAGSGPKGKKAARR